jgi:flagellar motor switch protein FliM
MDATERLVEVPRNAYDICNPERLPADRIAFVDGIHQQFVQAFGQALTDYLDMPIKAAPAGIMQLPLGKFLEGGAADACMVTLNVARGDQAWVGLSAGLIFRVLDIVLGAPQTAVSAARTAITEIEQHVLRDFFQNLVSTLDSAWRSAGISLSMASIGSAEAISQTVDLEGTAVILNCNVKIGDGEETFRVAMPVLAVRLALENEEKASNEVTRETADRTAHLEVLGAAAVQLEIILGGSKIRLGDLAAMKPGQILVLTQPAATQLECLVNGKAKFRGEWIAHGDRHGLQVHAVIDPALAQ